MSFGQQNNPYGPPQQQPGYAYPQQAPYPGQPYAPFPQQGGYHGMPPVPAEMPGITKAARIFMFVIAAAHLAFAAVYVIALGAFNDEVDKHEHTEGAIRVIAYGRGLLIFCIALAAVFAVIGLILAIRYAAGGNGVRVGSIVYASFAIISGLMHAAVYGAGLIVFVLAILTIVFCARRPSADWFQRPRY
ncbi:hypothetical protein ABT104_10265 [Streptomyces mobaraensis]|uniref:hypothetical protein n=1 Tax=Streptomyces mobaraensis TaxID=35621 RepID=UPI00331BE3E4